MTQRMDMQAQIITLESSKVTMAGFADMLTNMLQMGGGGGRQVVDMTDLKGNYQVAVEISLADAMAAARAQGINVPMPPAGGGGGGRLTGRGSVRPGWGLNGFLVGEKTRAQAGTAHSSGGATRRRPRGEDPYGKLEEQGLGVSTTTLS